MGGEEMQNKKATTVRLTDEAHKILDKISKRTKESKNVIILRLILESNKKGE